MGRRYDVYDATPQYNGQTAPGIARAVLAAEAASSSFGEDPVAELERMTALAYKLLAQRAIRTAEAASAGTSDSVVELAAYRENRR